MKCELKLEILNLHACPGDAQPSTYTAEVLQRMSKTKDTSRTLDDMEQRSEERGTEEVTKTERQFDLHEFKVVDGVYTARLGGPYGKFMGLLKSAGAVLYRRKVPPFKSSYKPLIKGIYVTPMWPVLEDVEGVEISMLPQIAGGRAANLIILYYRKISRCTVTLNLDMADEDKEPFEILMKQAERMPFGPKRRGQVNVLEVNWN